jgi:alpha-1,2-mannosyltransferase
VDTTQCVQTNNNINNERENIILSIGQFRPEKDHALQLHSFATFLTMYNKKDAMNDDDDSIQLVLIGSCRDDEDAYRVTRLKQLAKGLNIEQHVKFVINQPYSVIIDYLRRSSVGLHTMWNEHFGIGIVEMMAAGLVTIAHNSGGPMMDVILVPWDYTKTTEYKKNDCIPTGCLASTVDEYAKCMYEIFSRINKKKEKEEDDIISRIRDEGRRSAKRFSDEEFMNTFKETMLSSLLFESGSRDTIMTTTAYVMLVTMFVVFIAILIVLLKK